MWEVSEKKLSALGKKCGEYRGKMFLNSTLAIFLEIVTWEPELSFILTIAEKKSLTTWSDKYLAACQIFLMLSKKSS